MTPELLAALLAKFAVPEILRWLASLRSKGITVVSEEEALAKLEQDFNDGHAEGVAILETYHA